jgi:hypothetical protein
VKLTLCLAALLAIPVSAAAQANPGPFGGLFGRTPDPVSRDYTAVEVRASAGGLYDTSVFPEEGAVAAGIQGAAGASAGGVLAVDRVSERLSASISASVGHEQFFVDPSPYRATAYHGGAQIGANLTTRVKLEGGLNYSHSPYYQLISGAGNPGLSTDFLTPISAGAAAVAENETYNGSLGLSAQLGKRTTFQIESHREETRFRNQPASNLFVYGGRARLNHRLSRNLGVYAGYGRDQTNYHSSPSSDLVNELIDLGVDFNQEVTLARRTSLGFSAATGIVRDRSERRFRLNGSVGLSKHFRRTWQATLFAYRDTEFRPGFPEPLFSDSVSASLGGMLSERLEWLTVASAGRGALAFSATTGFKDIGVSSRLMVGISRHLGLYTQVSSYFSEVPIGVSTLPVSGRVEQRRVSVGLSAYIPVYNKVRATP